MINRNHKRLFALLLVFALIVGMIPSALADNEPDISAAESTKEVLVESQLEAEPIISPPMQSILESDEATEETEDPESTMEYEAPTSMDGETLTRTDNGGAMLLGGGGTMGKSTCVTFAAYQSARWKCHRYEVDGSHSYGHYFYTSEIAYHTIDGIDSYCIEPNTTSLGGQYYTSYTADEASSSSYWKLELDDLQRRRSLRLVIRRWTTATAVRYSTPPRRCSFGRLSLTAATMQTCPLPAVPIMRYRDT